MHLGILFSHHWISRHGLWSQLPLWLCRCTVQMGCLLCVSCRISKGPPLWRWTCALWLCVFFLLSRFLISPSQLDLFCWVVVKSCTDFSVHELFVWRSPCCGVWRLPVCLKHVIVCCLDINTFCAGYSGCLVHELVEALHLSLGFGMSWCDFFVCEPHFHCKLFEVFRVKRWSIVWLDGLELPEWRRFFHFLSYWLDGCWVDKLDLWVSWVLVGYDQCILFRFQWFAKVSRAVLSFWLVLYAVCLSPSGTQSKCSQRCQCDSSWWGTTTFGVVFL